MNFYNILIYDDDICDCEALKEILLALPLDTDVNVVTAMNIQDAKKLINAEISVVFLDIKLENDMNGINFAIYINKEFPQAKIIFITSHVKYSEEIFAANPSGFIIKPFTPEKVKLALDNLPRRTGNCYLIVNTARNSIEKIELGEIAYIENNARRLIFYNLDNEQKYVLRMRFSEIENDMPWNFIRCHHSFYVNLDKVSSIQRYNFLLKNGVYIPISQQRFRYTKDSFIKFLGESI